MESIETKIQEEYSDAMSPFERIIKRIFDVFVALVGIIVLFPLFVIIYIIIWFTGGEAIYKQKRIGYKGNPSIFTSSGLCIRMPRRMVSLVRKKSAGNR